MQTKPCIERPKTAVRDPAFRAETLTGKLLSQVKGGKKMSEIRVKEGESLESALRRFKRSTARSGVLAEVRKREAYEKPSVRRKKKSEAARKRKYK